MFKRKHKSSVSVPERKLSQKEIDQKIIDSIIVQINKDVTAFKDTEELYHYWASNPLAQEDLSRVRAAILNRISKNRAYLSNHYDIHMKVSLLT